MFLSFLLTSGNFIWLKFICPPVLINVIIFMLDYRINKNKHGTGTVDLDLN